MDVWANHWQDDSEAVTASPQPGPSGKAREARAPALEHDAWAGSNSWEDVKSGPETTASAWDSPWSDYSPARPPISANLLACSPRIRTSRHHPALSACSRISRPAIARQQFECCWPQDCLWTLAETWEGQLCIGPAGRVMPISRRFFWLTAHPLATSMACFPPRRWFGLSKGGLIIPDRIPAMSAWQNC